MVDIEARWDWSISHLLRIVHALWHHHLWWHHLFILIGRRVICLIGDTGFICLVRHSGLRVWMWHLALAPRWVDDRPLHHLVILLLDVPLVLGQGAASWRHLVHQLLLNFLVLLELLELLELEELLILVSWNKRVLLAAWNHKWNIHIGLLLELSLGLSELLSLWELMLLHHHWELLLLVLHIHMFELLLGYISQVHNYRLWWNLLLILFISSWLEQRRRLWLLRRRMVELVRFWWTFFLDRIHKYRLGIFFFRLRSVLT